MRLIACILSITIVFQSANLHLEDIIDLGEFIEHAQYHKEVHGDSFFEFLEKHYGSDKEAHNKLHEEERENHEKLPFHSDCQHLAVTVVFALTHFDYQFNHCEIDAKSTANFHYKFLYTAPDSEGVFQPPRFA